MTPPENHHDQQAEIELEERVQDLRNEAEDLRSLMRERFGEMLDWAPRNLAKAGSG